MKRTFLILLLYIALVLGITSIVGIHGFPWPILPILAFGILGFALLFYWFLKIPIGVHEKFLLVLFTSLVLIGLLIWNTFRNFDIEF